MVEVEVEIEVEVDLQFVICLPAGAIRNVVETCVGG